MKNVKLITALLLTACLSANAFKAKLKITLSPERAYIYKNDMLLGAGHIEIELANSSETSYTIALEGYATKIITFRYLTKMQGCQTCLAFDRGTNNYIISLDPLIPTGTSINIIKPKQAITDKPLKQLDKTAKSSPCEKQPQNTIKKIQNPPIIEHVSAIQPIINETSGKQTVFNAGTIYFFGYDFSHLKFIETKRADQGERITNLIPKWTAFAAGGLQPKHFERMLKVDNIICSYDQALNHSKNISESQVIGINKSSLNADSIQAWLNTYSFTGQSGVGFIVFVDCFYKPEKSTTGTYVFFDLATKQILLQEKYENSGADGYGLPAFWGEGLVDNVRHYMMDIFAKEKRRFLK